MHLVFKELTEVYVVCRSHTLDIIDNLFVAWIFCSLVVKQVVIPKGNFPLRMLLMFNSQATPFANLCFLSLIEAICTLHTFGTVAWCTLHFCPPTIFSFPLIFTRLFQLLLLEPRPETIAIPCLCLFRLLFGAPSGCLLTRRSSKGVAPAWH